MKCAILSIGGTSLYYGNIIDSNKRFGNFVAEYFCEYLRNHCKNRIDIHFYELFRPFDEILNIIANYDIVFYAIDFVNYDYVKELINVAKHNGITKHVLFGHMVSSYYKDVLDDIPADYCLIGDPENPGVFFLESYEKGELDFIAYPFIASRLDVSNKNKSICLDINRYPCFDFYNNSNNNLRKTHLISIKNNVCRFNCSFCWSNKGKYMFKDAERVLNEIKQVSLKYGITDLYFTDNDILDYSTEEEKIIIEDIFSGIAKLGLKFSIFCFAKSKSICERNKNILQIMKRAGVYCIFIGVDAGNESDRVLYNKISNFVEVENAINLLKEMDIWFRIGFISLNPYSNMQTLKENYLFLKKIQSSNYYHFGGTRVMLFKGTNLYKKVYEDGLLLPGYSFRNFYNYKFKSAEILPYVEYINNELIPALNNRIKTPYFALRKFFEMARIVGDVPDAREVLEIEKVQRKLLYNYYDIIFIDNDIQKAKQKKQGFVNSLEELSFDFNQRIEVYKNIYRNNTFIKRK